MQCHGSPRPTSRGKGEGLICNGHWNVSYGEGLFWVFTVPVTWNSNAPGACSFEGCLGHSCTGHCDVTPTSACHNSRWLSCCVSPTSSDHESVCLNSTACMHHTEGGHHVFIFNWARSCRWERWVIFFLFHIAIPRQAAPPCRTCGLYWLASSCGASL